MRDWALSPVDGGGNASGSGAGAGSSWGFGGQGATSTVGGSMTPKSEW